jgi:hypothetical protein
MLPFYFFEQKEAAKQELQAKSAQAKQGLAAAQAAQAALADAQASQAAAQRGGGASAREVDDVAEGALKTRASTEADAAPQPGRGTKALSPRAMGKVPGMAV